MNAPYTRKTDSTEALLKAIEQRISGVFLYSPVTSREWIAALTMAIARVADASNDNEGTAAHLEEMAALIRAGKAMKAKA